MALHIGREDGNTNGASKHIVVANGVTVNIGDLVYFNGAGLLTNAAGALAGAKLVGMSLHKVVGDAVKKAMVINERTARYVIPVNSGTFDNTNIGQNFNLAVVSGRQEVDPTPAAGGSLVCINNSYDGVVPTEAGKTYAVFAIAKHAFDNS